MRKSRSKKRPKIIYFLIAFVVFVFLFVNYVNFKISPVIKDISTLKAHQVASECISSVIFNVLDSEEIEYESLVKLTLNDNGEIRSAQSNILSINRLRSILVREITSALKKLSNKSFSVSFGTVVGVPTFMGKGPDLKFKVSQIGSVNAEFTSEFVSAGINQTLHRIIINIKTDIMAIMTPITEKSEICLSFVVAETVIVGDVPDGFYNLS